MLQIFQEMPLRLTSNLVLIAIKIFRPKIKKVKFVTIAPILNKNSKEIVKRGEVKRFTHDLLELKLDAPTRFK